MKKPGQWTRIIPNLAGTEGADANTIQLDFEVTDSLIQSMIDLAHELRRLGVRDVNGTLTYDEEGSV